MLERAAALRQWGLRWRKVGVLVRRAEDASEEAARSSGCSPRRQRRSSPASP